MGPHRKRLLQGEVERCGVSNFDSLHAMVVDIVGGMDHLSEIASITRFCDALREAQGGGLARPPIPITNFFPQAYPPYLAALSNEAYYLSDVELLALCRCAATNVVIFKHNLANGSLTYLRSAIADDAAPLMLTSIQVNPRAASVRSHFQK